MSVCRKPFRAGAIFRRLQPRRSALGVLQPPGSGHIGDQAEDVEAADRNVSLAGACEGDAKLKRPDRTEAEQCAAQPYI